MAFFNFPQEIQLGLDPTYGKLLGSIKQPIQDAETGDSSRGPRMEKYDPAMDPSEARDSKIRASQARRKQTVGTTRHSAVPTDIQGDRKGIVDTQFHAVVP